MIERYVAWFSLIQIQYLDRDPGNSNGHDVYVRVSDFQMSKVTWRKASFKLFNIICKIYLQLPPYLRFKWFCLAFEIALITLIALIALQFRPHMPWLSVVFGDGGGHSGVPQP